MNGTVLALSFLFAFGSTFVLAFMFRKKLSKMNMAGEYSWDMIFSYSLVTMGALYGIWYGFVYGYSFEACMLFVFFSLITGLGISLGL
ncbi:MAG: hypothetical protein AAB461_03085, partial [Patescibacteria group bacterium]